MTPCRRSFLFLIAFLLVAGGAVWLFQDTAGPHIRFDRVLFSAGDVIPEQNGPFVSHRFRFVNSGNRPLEVGELESCCGCTVEPLANHVFLPGEEGFIDVKLLLPPVGRVERSILVNCNSPESPVRLSVAATARPRAVALAVPERLVLTDVDPDRPAGRRLTVNALTQEPLTVAIDRIDVESARVGVDVADIARARDAGSAGYFLTRFSLEVVPRTKTVGTLSDKLRIHFQPSSLGVLEVDVEMNVLPEWVLRPSRILFVLTDERPVGLRKEATLRRRRGGYIEARYVDNPYAAWLEVTALPMPDQREIGVSMTLRARPEKPALDAFVKILVADDAGTTETVEVPFVIRFLAADGGPDYSGPRVAD